MSRVDNFRKVPAKIPYKSGFDKSYRSSLTGTCGTLIPLLCDELIPNEDVYLRVPFVLRMAPLASDTFMNVDYKFEAFFVPSRLLMRGYERFILGDTAVKSQSGDDCKIRVPVIDIADIENNVLGSTSPGSLLDYLGFGIGPRIQGAAIRYINGLPALAYGLIYDEWYRNSYIQKSLYNKDTPWAISYTASHMHSVTPSDDANVGYILDSTTGVYEDSTSIFDLRQRNFGADYFTVATPSPQNGPAVGVGLTLETNNFSNIYSDLLSGDPWDSTDPTFVSDLDNSIADHQTRHWPADPDGKSGNLTLLSGVTANQTPSQKLGGFTISSLRAANSLQIFLERNNIQSERFTDFVKANYGADLKDGVAQRPVYLGSASFPVYVNGVMANGEPNTSGLSKNPFNTVASQYGSAHAEGNEFVVKFHADEPGYLFVIGSLVPEVSYSGGIDKMLMRYTRPDSRTDMPNHLLQNIGPQPIYNYECTVGNDQFANNVFGYVDRYADFMVKSNQVHALMKDNQSLESFVLQRTLNVVDGINSAFLTIPVDFLDQITSVDSENSGFAYWMDIYFEYKVSMPLARYSIPSLQDPAYEHGDTVWLNRGGVRID